MAEVKRDAQVREFVDDAGDRWIAFAPTAVVAHGREGAVLAFRRANEEDGLELRSTVTFNSQAAADFALRTLGEKELRRRLALARMAAGSV
ncbi:MAG: hypothetical protein WD766_05970 [Gemmatimonadota bacterium]